MVNEIALGHTPRNESINRKDISMSDHGMIDYHQPSPDYQGFRINPAPSSDSPSPHEDVEYAKEYVDEMPLTIEEQYKQRLCESLKRNNYNRKKAAQELGISERTLYRKIIKFGLNAELC